MLETTHATADTFPRLMLQHARTQPLHPAFREKDLGIWQTTNWAQVEQLVRLLACGLALSRKLRGEGGRVWCLMSDGEWNEGSNWESLIFARQQQLANLSVIVDVNGLQGFGTTAEVADLRPLAVKLRDFGWEVDEVDGHDPAAITAAGRRQAGGPHAILAATTKGRGVSFMEGRVEWHYLPLTRELYEQAVGEVQSAGGSSSAATG